ncbi:hypothetical protein [Kytococcus sedentarius]|uniref:hypothetical protein n=1 Tax=Kytococcus sedentarius TaxID=1276 RepID=UPI0035BBA032
MTRPTRTLAGLSALTLAATGLAGCSSSSEGPRVAVWETPWGHTDKGFEARFDVVDDCLVVEVEGTQYLAVLPGGSEVGDSTITAPGDEYPVGEQVTVGGAAFALDEAREVTELSVPSECGDKATTVWLVT